MSGLAASIGLSVSLALSASLQIPSFQTAADLVRIVTNPENGSDERDRALSSLAGMDFQKALEIAPSLLSEADGSLRARAAWILADGGSQNGLDALRAMAQERTGECVIAMEMLGRLRDPGSHNLLAALLEQELASPNRQGSFPNIPSSESIISALSGALADYADKRDTALLVRTIPAKVGAGHFVMIERLGRAGGKEAVPVLERIFEQARGWTQMAAGLGLARSGSAKGLKYVRDRLADTSGDPNNPNETRTTNAEKDNSYGPKATDFILDHLGVSADEIFVPDLIRIASSPEYSWVRKAQAWRALSRLNPVADRQKILALAWKNLTDSSAVKLIVLNEESRVATVSRQLDSSSDGKEKATARDLRRALATTSRERRRWREIHGYTF